MGRSQFTARGRSTHGSPPPHPHPCHRSPSLQALLPSALSLSTPVVGSGHPFIGSGACAHRQALLSRRRSDGIASRLPGGHQPPYLTAPAPGVNRSGLSVAGFGRHVAPQRGRLLRPPRPWRRRHHLHRHMCCHSAARSRSWVPPSPAPDRRHCVPCHAGRRDRPGHRRLDATSVRRLARSGRHHASVHRGICSLVALVPGAFTPSRLGRQDGVGATSQWQRPQRAGPPPASSAAFAAIEFGFALVVSSPWPWQLVPHWHPKILTARCRRWKKMTSLQRFCCMLHLK
jgi:hypothetical protein